MTFTFATLNTFGLAIKKVVSLDFYWACSRNIALKNIYVTVYIFPIDGEYQRYFKVTLGSYALLDQGMLLVLKYCRWPIRCLGILFVEYIVIRNGEKINLRQLMNYLCIYLLLSFLSCIFIFNFNIQIIKF